uniref:Ig-like domain-containing protein n=1 Tax=Amphiprion percula TaxID=161767 RepID=A0A3P8SM44_AMPPE
MAISFSLLLSLELKYDITVTKGGDVTLQCAAEGVPRPAVTWLKDGRPITGQHGAKVLNEGQLLQIKDAKVSDTGRYTCIAVNVAGQADSKHDVIPPVISSETQKYVAPVDSSVTLQCQADGSPPPSVTWHKDGQQLRESVRQRVLSSGSLQMAFIQPSDAGRYTCTAANVAGTVKQEVAVVENSQAQLVCIADGVPQPTLSWEKDGSPLSEGAGEFTILPSGELVIDITQVKKKKKEIDRLRRYRSSCYITTVL